MPRELRSTAFPSLVKKYADEGKIVVGFTVFEAGEKGTNGKDARLDVRWVDAKDAPAVSEDSGLD